MRARRATPHDEAEIKGMQLLCLPGDEPEEMDAGSHWWIVEDDGQPVAFACIRQSRRWFDTWYLSRAGVMPVARGMGLQKKLIRTRLAAAKKAGKVWVVTDVNNDKPASMASLIACGFKPFWPSDPYALETSTYWRKKL
jgi:ribosomal protein S18 acetylase RimI-like enzyme